MKTLSLLAVGGITALLLVVSPASLASGMSRRAEATRVYEYVLGRYPRAGESFDLHVSPPLALTGRAGHLKLTAFSTFRAAQVGKPRPLALCRALIAAVRRLPVRGVTQITIWSRGLENGSGATVVAESVAPHGCTG